MPSTVPEIAPLVNNFTLLLLTHQSIFKQGRIFRRVIVLAFAEVLAFNRHTVTLLLCWAWPLATGAVCGAFCLRPKLTPRFSALCAALVSRQYR